MKASLKSLSLKHATQAIGTTKDRLQSLINDALHEGQSVSQLAKAIRDDYVAIAPSRSQTIARTELTRVITNAKVRTLAEEGYTEKEWSTVVDGRQRETHQQANGQVVGINDYFHVGGSAAFAPGDEGLPPEESINCRCDVVGAGTPEDRKLHLGKLFLRVHGQLEKTLVVHLRREFERQRKRVLSHFPS